MLQSLTDMGGQARTTEGGAVVNSHGDAHRGRAATNTAESYSRYFHHVSSSLNTIDFVNPITGRSGSAEFDALKAKVDGDPQLRGELEAVMRLSVETYNPSDRGIRFITGAIGEWMIACAAYTAGVLSIPAGHNANGYDLQDLKKLARGLWSVKSSFTPGGSFIITNGRDGGGAGFVEPTIFSSPDLPGLVFAHPALHLEVLAGQVEKADSKQIPKAVIRAHATAHPECVINCAVPRNEGLGQRDPAFEAVRLLLADNIHFPRLGKMFADTKRLESSLVAELRELQAMRSAGDLTQAQYEAMLDKLTVG